MKTRNSFAVVKAIGFALVIMGLSLFYFAVPIVIALGLFAMWILTWLIVFCVSTGSFLIVRRKTRCSFKSLLSTLALLVPWSAMLLIHLQNDIQILLATLIALGGILLYKYYWRFRSGNELLNNHQSIAKVFWVFFIITCTVFAYLVFYLAISYSLFIAYVSLVPLSLIIIIEYSVVTRVKLKKSIEIWLSFIILIMIPWLTVLLNVYQILLVFLLLGSLILAAHYYYRRKQKSHASVTK